jgi:hypothetical protein
LKIGVCIQKSEQKN